MKATGIFGKHWNFRLGFAKLSGIFLLVCLPSASAQGKDDSGKDNIAREFRQKLGKETVKEESVSKTTQERKAYVYEQEMPTDIDALMGRIAAENQSIIDNLDALNRKDPTSPQVPERMFRAAEYEWEIAHYDYLQKRKAYIEKQEAKNEDSEDGPTPDYSKAIERYKIIVDKYPDYKRNEEVLFRLGDGLIRDGKASEGVSYLRRLTKLYPESPRNDAAYLALGEYYFAKHSTGTAQAAYGKILEDYPNSPIADYAEYKLAWTFLNIGDEDSAAEAIGHFRNVIDKIDKTHADAMTSDGQIDENKLKKGTLSFRNQAINDLAATYVELPSGWVQAKDYLSQRLPADKAREKLEALLSVLDGRGKFEDEIALADYLMAQNPLHKNAHVAMRAKIDAKKSMQIDVAADTDQAIQSYLPDTPWHKENCPKEKQSCEDAGLWAKFLLSRKIAQQLETINASKNPDDELFDAAHRSLTLYSDKFPQDENIVDMAFYDAFVLDEWSDKKLVALKKKLGKNRNKFSEEAVSLLPMLRQAAAMYQKVIDLGGSDPESVKNSAARQVFVYANILTTADPDISLEKISEAKNFKAEKAGDADEEAQELTESEGDFVKSVEQYTRLYPKDGQSPVFSWRAAEIYRTANHYNEAAQRFDHIVTNFPEHIYAAISVGSMFELYSKAKNWPKVDEWARWLIDKKNFKYYTLAQLQDTSAFAIARQSDALKDDEAVDKLNEIAHNFPERSDLIAQAALKKAGLRKNAMRYADALNELAGIAEGEQVFAEAQMQSAQILAEAGDFEKAVDFYVAASQNEKVENDALLGALTIANATENHALLIDLLGRYLANCNDNCENTGLDAEKARTLLAESYARQDNVEKAFAEYEALVEQYDSDNQKVAIHRKMIELSLKHDNLAKAKRTLDKAEKLKIDDLREKAWLAFMKGEIAFYEFNHVKLEFPVRELRKTIDKKAKIRQQAEKFYKDTINIKYAPASVASANRIAQMALNFRDAFKALPLPQEVANNPEKKEEYLTWLEDELIFPAEDAATQLLDYSKKIADSLNILSPDVIKTATELQKLQSSQYPVRYDADTLHRLTDKP